TVEGAMPLINQRVARPACLSGDCVHLVRDMLGKGSVHFLAREGGWRRERYLRGGAPRDGRLWERTEPPDLGLPFSGYALEFLMQLTADKPAEMKGDNPHDSTLQPGDRFLLFLAYESVRETEAA